MSLPALRSHALLSGCMASSLGVHSRPREVKSLRHYFTGLSKRAELVQRESEEWTCQCRTWFHGRRCCRQIRHASSWREKKAGHREKRDIVHHASFTIASQGSNEDHTRRGFVSRDRDGNTTPRMQHTPSQSGWRSPNSNLEYKRLGEISLCCSWALFLRIAIVYCKQCCTRGYSEDV